jgi:hypothetical protein
LPTVPVDRARIGNVALVVTAGIGAADLARALADARAIPQQTDLTVYLAAAQRLAHGICVYSPTVTAALRGSTVPEPLFVNPPPIAAALLPLASTSLSRAVLVFLAASLLATAAAVWLGATRLLPPRLPLWQRLLVAAVAAATFPAIQVFAFTGWDGFLLLALVGSLLLLRGGRPLLAGLAGAVFLLKPQLAWGVPLVFLVAREWRALAGFALGGVVWAAGSLATASPSCLRQIAGNVGVLAGQVNRSVGLPGLFDNATRVAALSTALSVLLAAATVAACWHWRRPIAADPAAAIALVTVAVLLGALHAFGDDLMLLMPALLLAARARPGLVIGAVLLLDAALRLDMLVDPHQSVAVGIVFAGLAVAGLLVFRPDRARPASPPAFGPVRPTPPTLTDPV